MDAYLNEVVPYLLSQSWQIAVLVAGVAAVTFALRNRSAHVRYLLWMIVLAKCLVPPLYAVPLRLLPPSVPDGIGPVLSWTQGSEEPVAVVNPTAQDAPGPHQESAPPSLTPHTGAPRLSTSGWLAILWVAGAGVYLMLNLLRAARGQYWLRRTRRPLPEEVRVDSESLLRTYGIRRLPRVWIMEGIGQPFVWGLWRGSIYVPPALLAIESPQHRRDILAHELSHVLRFDAAVNTLQVIAQGLFWFHPFVWWANRKIRQEREKCCDEMAIAYLSARPKEYSTALVSTLIEAQESIRPVPTLAVAGPVKNIEERIKAMLRPGKRFYRRPSLIAATTVFLAALLTVPTALVLTARAQTEAPKAQTKTTYPLHEAARAGDIEKVDSLIAKGASVDEEDEKDRTPLHSAAWSGRSDVAELLLAKGANINAMDVSGRTPLHLAVTFAEGSVVELLIAKGANPSARDKEGNTPLHSAAGYWGAHKGLLALLLAKGAEVNARNDSGQTPLHIIIATPTRGKYQENVVAAAFLLANGAEVNAKDKNGCTPLYVAAENGRRDMAELLLGRGAVINAKTNDGLTPLHRAAMLGRKDVAALLLNRIGRYDSNAKGLYDTDSRGWTAMHHAARGGYNDMIELLIDYDADLNPKNTRGETPVHLAIVQNHKDTVKLLISKGAGVSTIHVAAYIGDLARVKSFVEKGVSVNAQDGFGLTPLHAAAGAGQREAAEFLIGKGAAVNAEGVAEGPGTPLHYAANGGSQEVAQLLISKGAIIDSRNRNGETPLHLAAQKGYNDLARPFIANKADVNARTQNGWTPLHWAAWIGHKDIAALLIQSGGDINARGERSKETPLLCAAWSNHKDVMKLLIDKGADVSPVDDLLYSMCEHGHRDLAEFFIKKGANVNSSNAWGGNAPSLVSVWNNHPDVLKLLLDHGANPDAKDRHDWTLLHYTIDSRCRSLEMTRMLIEKGANPNAKITGDGSTPFYWAVGYDLKEVVDLFIAKGADINAKGNNEGRTALHQASEGNKDMAEFLIAKGADVNTKDNKGRTALSLAKEQGHDEIVELLLKHGAKE